MTIHRRSMLRSSWFWLVATLAVPGLAPAEAPLFPQGVAVGDVTAESAVFWTRTSRPACLHLKISTDKDYSRPLIFEFEDNTQAERDFTAQASVRDLQPNTQYFYYFEEPAGQDSPAPRVSGTFRTAPKPNDDIEVSFVVAGDVGGQGYCRHRDHGYQGFAAMARQEPDFFVANGDLIYADNACPATGPGGWPNIPGDFAAIGDVDWSVPGLAKEAILGHWRYNRADPHQQKLLASTPIYAQWDDHEVINDFGAAWPYWPPAPERAGYPTLVADARDALFHFNPIDRHAEEPHRIYRSFRWGQHLELFLIDARSYRSANDLVDTPGSGKTLLGAEQLAWLKKSVQESDATWKIISSDVPISVPTGSQSEMLGRDAFANGEEMDFSKRTGAERELLDLLTFFDRHKVRNLVVVTTDVHFAAHLRYQIDLDGDGGPLLFHELISGPLNAWRLSVPSKLDPTLKPAILYAEGGIFNYSHVRLVRIDGAMHLVAEIHNEKGEPRFGSRLQLAPQ